jgi:hypothetical protein
MSPVDRSRGHTGRALAVSGVAIAVIFLLLWGASVMANRRSSLDVRLGDQTFEGLSAKRMAAEIDEDGPIFFGDISDSDNAKRDIILQHLGDDPDTGWYAFRAQPDDKGRDCEWQWQPDEELFRAECDRSLTAPADGQGLESYKVTVRDGKLDVDLNFEDRSTTTTEKKSTTTIIESGEPPPTTEN